MGYNKSNLVAEPFTNSIGQTLNPGDDVVVVTNCTSRVNVTTGKFAGVRRDMKTNEIVGTSISDIKRVHFERVYSEHGKIEEVKIKDYDYNLRKYNSEKTGRRYDVVPVTKYRKTTLHRNRVFKIDTPLNDIND
jgi:hypothetical protein